MSNTELINKIYEKWLEYGEKIKEAFNSNAYALDSIQEAFNDAKEDYNYLINHFGDCSNLKKYNLLNKKLEDILNKIESQYDLAESLAEYNNTFAEDILFDVWIDYMTNIIETLNKVN